MPSVPARIRRTRPPRPPRVPSEAQPIPDRPLVPSRRPMRAPRPRTADRPSRRPLPHDRPATGLDRCATDLVRSVPGPAGRSQPSRRARAIASVVRSTPRARRPSASRRSAVRRGNPRMAAASPSECPSARSPRMALRLRSDRWPDVRLADAMVDRSESSKVVDEPIDHGADRRPRARRGPAPSSAASRASAAAPAESTMPVRTSVPDRPVRPKPGSTAQPASVSSRTARSMAVGGPSTTTSGIIRPRPARRPARANRRQVCPSPNRGGEPPSAARGRVDERSRRSTPRPSRAGRSRVRAPSAARQRRRIGTPRTVTCVGRPTAAASDGSERAAARTLAPTLRARGPRAPPGPCRRRRTVVGYRPRPSARGVRRAGDTPRTPSAASSNALAVAASAARVDRSIASRSSRAPTSMPTGSLWAIRGGGSASSSIAAHPAITSTRNDIPYSDAS